MLSRLISPATKPCSCSRALLAKNVVFKRGLATDYREKVMSTGRPVHPDVFTGEQDDESGEVAKHEDSILQGKEKNEARSRQSHPYVPPRTPFASSHHLENKGVSPPIDPSKQQQTRRIKSADIEQASCDVAIDGRPLRGKESDDRHGRKRQVQELDDKEYYKEHKASPLSEREIADTRKPMTRAMDATADYYMSEGGIVVFREEQHDTADDSLRRAAEIWRENAIRGDPDSPHGRVLRALRGEYW